MAKIPSLDIDFKVHQMMTEEDFERMSSFHCGVSELDYFFQNEVRECVNKRYLASYCATLPTNEIVAAFTLMNDALMVTPIDKQDFIDDMRFETSDDIVDFFKRQTSYPAVNIGHLGTSTKFQDKGIGSAIIDLVVETFTKYNKSGCQFITVDALNNSRTTRFYVRNYFNFQTNRDFWSPTRRMYRIL